MTITGRAVGGDLGKSRLGLAAFAGFGERAGGLESGAALGGLLALPPHIAAPGRNRRDQQNGCGDGIIAVAVPQLLELLSTDFLVDFLKDVGHERPRPIPALARTHRSEANSLSMWHRQGKAGSR